jgi:hypothetical protein
METKFVFVLKVSNQEEIKEIFFSTKEEALIEAAHLFLLWLPDDEMVEELTKHDMIQLLSMIERREYEEAIDFYIEKMDYNDRWLEIVPKPIFVPSYPSQEWINQIKETVVAKFF